MEPYLERLAGIDGEIKEAETGLGMYLRWMINNSPIPKTVNLLWSYQDSIGQLKAVVFNIADNSHMLSAKIVYRTFLEQYLRFFYLFVRAFRENNDSTAIRYSNALEIMEDFACKRADALTLKIYQEREITIAEMWDALKVTRTDLAKYSLMEVEQLLQEFSWDGITHYLETSKGQEGPGGPTDFIFEHALTLCFIHGGLGLDDALDIYKSSNEAPSDEALNEFNRMCTSALDLCTTVKMYSCHFYRQYNADFDVILKRLRVAANKIHEE